MAAHTSAGKTVVAEYAFAMALRDGSRVIYTSPLKALSNQKYREFQEKFGDVGLMTGDVVINPSASCLVMTTEILRSMLYRGSEVIREASLIVYDEIHYLRDKERGVVWEESIILAPETARFAFLSATIPNAREFADWIATTHKSPCHVVYTDYRPTPLQHFLYPVGADGLFLVVDERGRFREDSFSKAVAALNDAEAAAASSRADSKSKLNGNKEKGDIRKIVEMCMLRNFDPMIVFSFSKTECDALADQMHDMDLTTDEEKPIIEAIYTGAIEVLAEQDRRLADVQNIIGKLRRGLGVHHAGMLPILKELTEILFQEGFLKVLFATETFSTGLNMPAKTVVFTNARKFDGGRFRWVSSGEYIQMSGRAGRRGLDDKGTVILMLDAKLDPPTAKDMLRGAPDPLFSEFHLTYAMLLSMLRVDGAEPEELMRRSYRQFQAEKVLPQLEARVAALEADHDAIIIEDEELIELYADLQKQRMKLKASILQTVYDAKYALPFLQPGRLIKILPPGCDRGGTDDDEKAGIWVAVVNFKMIGSSDLPAADKETESKEGGKAFSVHSRKKKDKNKVVLVDVLAACAGSTTTGERPIPVSPFESSSYTPNVIGVTLDEVVAISSLRVHIQKDLRATESRVVSVKVIAEVEKRFANTASGIPVLDAEKDLRVVDEAYFKYQKRLDSVNGMLKGHPLADSPTLESRLSLLSRKKDLASEVRAAKKEVKAATGLILHEDLKARRRVLRRLGCVDSHGVVTKKGRTAGEISTGDELVLCELVYGGVFGPLTAPQTAALVSCFVWREKSEVRGAVPQDMEGAYAALKDAARRVGRAESEAGISVDIDAYMNSFKPDLMQVVLAWAGGATFAHISDIAGKGIYAGSLARAVRRLEELLRQIGVALRAVGDVELAGKFELAIEKIKRDIIFASSLFL